MKFVSSTLLFGQRKTEPQQPAEHQQSPAGDRCVLLKFLAHLLVNVFLKADRLRKTCRSDGADNLRLVTELADYLARSRGTL